MPSRTLAWMRGRRSLAVLLATAGLWWVAQGLALWFGGTWLDPLASLIIAAIIVVGAWGLFRQSLHLLFDSVPDNVGLHAVQGLLRALPGVAQVHDLHVRAMGARESEKRFMPPDRGPDVRAARSLHPSDQA